MLPATLVSLAVSPVRLGKLLLVLAEETCTYFATYGCALWPLAACVFRPGMALPTMDAV